MADQDAILAFELCDHYRNIWAQPSVSFFSTNPAFPLDTNRIRQENGERIMKVTKWAFTSVVSVMEFCAKETNGRYPAVLSLPKAGHLYLWNVLSRSREKQLIDRLSARAWSGLLEMRNVCVHNNGVAEKTMIVRLTNGVSIPMKKGEMTKGDLLTFVRLSTWAVEAYAAWCDAFLTRAGIGP